MPFNTTAAVHVLSVIPHLDPGTRFCHLCHHELEVADHFLRWLVQHRDSFPFVDATRIEAILETDPEDRKSMVADYYRALGMGEMRVLESHSRFDSTVVDFNLSLEREFDYRERFNFVDNTGVTEHVFDQRAVFENIHQLCNPGGVMLHRIPMSGVLNITLYCVTPLFLIDLAQANRYEILDFRIANRWGDTVAMELEGHPDKRPPLYRSALPVYPGNAAGLAGEGPRTQVWQPADSIPESCRLPDHLTVAEMLQKTSLANEATALGRACAALTERGRYFRPENPGELYAMIVCRKRNAEPFRLPYQSTSLFEIEPPEMRRRYRHQFEALGIPVPEDPDGSASTQG